MHATNDRRKVDRDRRRSPRIPATFAVRESVGGRVQLCQAEEIGPGGLTMKRPRDAAHPPRTALALRFELPGTGQEIDASGLVTHDTGAGSFRRTGVGFVALRSEHQQAIAAFVRAAAARGPRPGPRASGLRPRAT